MFPAHRTSHFVRTITVAKRDITTIIMGPPGGGKGTISKKQVSDYGYHHISTGDLLRDQIRRGTSLGLKAQDMMKQGLLVSDDVVIGMVADELAGKTGKHILLDGFPRTKAQAEALKQKQINVDVVLNLEVPTEDIVQRISSRWTHLPSGRVYAYDYNPPKIQGKDDVTGEDLIQREDDKAEAVTKRLRAYDSATAPLIEYYRADGALYSYSGDNRPDLVQKGKRSDAIYEAVKELLNKVHKK